MSEPFNVEAAVRVLISRVDELEREVAQLRRAVGPVHEPQNSVLVNVHPQEPEVRVIPVPVHPPMGMRY